MKPKVYIETSVVSYLTARTSRDLVSAMRQEATQVWWEEERSRYDLFISAAVTLEARRGNPAAAAWRLNALEGLETITPGAQTEALAQALLTRRAVPREAAVDAAHIAAATLGGADYLLTWNFKHIANPALRKRIEATCRSMGYEPPVICTPEELLSL